MLCADEDSATDSFSAAAPWQRRRYWPSPPPHAMLLSAQPQPMDGLIKFQAVLLQSKLAWMWEHQVCVLVIFTARGI